MTSWPTPHPLRLTYSVQKESATLRHVGQSTTLAFLGTGLVLILCMGSYLDSPHPMNAFVPFFFFLVLILCVLKYTKSYRNSTPEIESRSRTHEDWRNIFMPRDRPRKEFIIHRYQNWLLKFPYLLRYPHFERLIFTIELGLCIGAIFPATFLAIHYSSQSWFLVPMICAWLNLITIPFICANYTIVRMSSIWIPFGSTVMIGITLTFTLTPFLAYGDRLDNIAFYDCIMLSTICCFHW